MDRQCRVRQPPLDYNREDQEGVGYFQMTIKDGRRCSSAAAYLKPARKRPNLHIFTNAHSEKLLIDGNNVTGVRCEIKGQSVDVSARREVILSAGSIGSPQVLMLSGIGDAAELQPHGIDVVHHLPGVVKICKIICRPGQFLNVEPALSTLKLKTCFDWRL